MGDTFKENSKAELCMVKAPMSGRMAVVMKVNTNSIRNMVLELTPIQMEVSIEVLGQMVCNMVMVA